MHKQQTVGSASILENNNQRVGLTSYVANPNVLIRNLGYNVCEALAVCWRNEICLICV